MTQGVLQTDIYTDFQGLNALRSRARTGVDKEETLKEVAGQFEALFLQMMLKSMREASLGEGMLNNEHTKTYQAMFDKQISIEMSTGRGIGLAEMMVKQLRRQDGAGNENTDVKTPTQTQTSVPSRQTFPGRTQAASVLPATDTPDVRVDKSSPPDWKPESPKEFVRALWPQAKRAAGELGVQPETLIAQAALETGWGQYPVRAADGSNSFNLFGIKADADWQGARVTKETVEFRDGLMRKERAQFRAYASPQESFSDYVDFLKTSPRYRDALRQASDAPAFTRALSEAGYATDPEYAGKINRIMGSSHMREALGNLQTVASEPRR